MNARFSAHLNNWKGVIPMSENGDILEELWEVKRKMAEKFSSFHEFFADLLKQQDVLKAGLHPVQ